MARIRTIKPEFWSSPGIESLDPFSRLLYIAMWGWADDNGVGTCNPRELMGYAFPLDEELTVGEVRRMLDGIRRVFGVTFYTVAGRPYYAIPSWDKHQKIDRRSTGKFPGPEQADALETPGNTRARPHSAETHEDPPSVRRDSGAGTGEQRNRGTGEEEPCSPAPPSSERAPDRFDEFWDIYPRKVGKQKARAKFSAATKRATAQEVIDGAQRLATDPNLPDTQFIPHPTTWLERDGWEDEPLAPRVSDMTSSQRRLMQAAQIAQQQTGHLPGLPPPTNPFAGKEITR